MSWNNPKDLEKDLLYYSEIQTSPNDEPAPLPVTLAQWNAHNGFNREQSIFDTPHFESGVTMISSGRGRGRCSELYRPGRPVVYSTSEDDEIKRRLQQVNSHSYSNVHMEAALRMNTRSSDEFCDAKEANENGDNSLNTLLKKNSLHINQSLSPIKEVNKSSLLPLSQMRQNAKQRSKPQKIELHSSVSKPKLYSQVLSENKT